MRTWIHNHLPLPSAHALVVATRTAHSLGVATKPHALVATRAHALVATKPHALVATRAHALVAASKAAKTDW